MGNTYAARSKGADDDTPAFLDDEKATAFLDDAMPGALAAIILSIPVPDDLRRRALAIAEALLLDEPGEAGPPPSGRRQTPSCL